MYTMTRIYECTHIVGISNAYDESTLLYGQVADMFQTVVRFQVVVFIIQKK